MQFSHKSLFHELFTYYLKWDFFDKKYGQRDATGIKGGNLFKIMTKGSLLPANDSFPYVDNLECFYVSLLSGKKFPKQNGICGPATSTFPSPRRIMWRHISKEIKS